jgi:hypothetical protein
VAALPAATAAPRDALRDAVAALPVVTVERLDAPGGPRDDPAEQRDGRGARRDGQAECPVGQAERLHRDDRDVGPEDARRAGPDECRAGGPAHPDATHREAA